VQTSKTFELLASDTKNLHTSSMSLKNAATVALVGTLLTAALLVWRFVFDVVNVVRGLIPAADLFSSLLYAFAAVSLAVFFYIFQRSQK
jgi:hypothetical protein